MHLVSDVSDSVYTLLNYPHFINRVKLVIINYLLITSLILQPCSAAIGRQKVLSKSSRTQNSESDQPEIISSSARISQIENMPKVKTKLKPDGRECNKLYGQLVQRSGLNELQKKQNTSCPKTQAGENTQNWYEYFKYLAHGEPEKEICGLPGYSAVIPEKDEQNKHQWGILFTPEIDYAFTNKEINESHIWSVKSTCKNLFRKNETTTHENSDENSSLPLEDLLSKLRLPFCGYYNILIEEAFPQNFTLYNQCMRPRDTLLTLKHILAPHSGSNSTPLITESNCEAVLTYLTTSDYKASVNFYGHFVASLARYDCRVPGKSDPDYTVGAVCFNCAVAYRQWICGTSVRPPEELLNPISSSILNLSSTSPLAPSSDQSRDQNVHSSSFLDEKRESEGVRTRQQGSRTKSADVIGATTDTERGSQGDKNGNGIKERGRGGMGKPCNTLCHRVELLCPFLNPSLASGGRPVFECPPVTGVDEIDFYSNDQNMCYNPYQNSSLDSMLQTQLDLQQLPTTLHSRRNAPPLRADSWISPSSRRKRSSSPIVTLIRRVTSNAAISPQQSSIVLASLETVRGLMIALFYDNNLWPFYGGWRDAGTVVSNSSGDQLSAYLFSRDLSLDENCLHYLQQKQQQQQQQQQQHENLCSREVGEGKIGGIVVGCKSNYDCLHCVRGPLSRARLLERNCISTSERGKEPTSFSMNERLLNLISTLTHVALYLCVVSWIPLPLYPFR